MDYLNSIKGSFIIDRYHQLTAYFKDGSSLAIQDEVTDDHFDSVCYKVANYINRNNDYNILNLVGYTYTYNGDDYYLVSTNKLDFYLFQYVNLPSSYSSDLSVMACRVYEDNGQLSTFDDYGAVNNYAEYNSNISNFVIEQPYYGEYIVPLDINYNSCLFDYSNLHYSENTYNGYLTDALPVRGENISFYNTMFYIENVGVGDIFVSFGSPINDLLQDEYTRGYGNGWSGGYIQGKDDGYIIGFNSNGNIGNEQASAFSYIGTAFNSVGQLLSIEVMPNITLGLCFSIPLTFVLIMTIFKLVRK